MKHDENSPGCRLSVEGKRHPILSDPQSVCLGEDMELLAKFTVRAGPHRAKVPPVVAISYSDEVVILPYHIQRKLCNDECLCLAD